MRRFSGLAIIGVAMLGFIGAQHCSAADEAAQIADARAQGKTSAPAPKYPKDAHGNYPTGSGIVLMQVDSKTGHVTSARMLKSTGHKILDAAALEAFRRWRFKRGTVSQVKTPIEFTLDPSHHRAQTP